MNRKRRFDDKVCPVTFKTGDQVQVYDSKLDTTFDTKAKLLLRWSPPRRITQKHLNSYTLSTLNGRELPGTVHARRLHHYTPQGDETTGEQDPETGEQQQAKDEEELGEAIRELFREEDVARVHATEF